MSKKILLVILSIVAFLSILIFFYFYEKPQPPYPQSTILKGVVWDQNTHRHFAPGSDNWPMTWSDDGAIYAAWGDGGGFGGTNNDGRVSLGVARIFGDGHNYRGENVWGGNNHLNPAQFGGKSYGILSVNGRLYMAFYPHGPKQAPYRVGQFAVSLDHGATFQRGFTFEEPDAAFAVCTFLNFGRDYQNSRDDYVYIYSGQPLNGCTDRCIGEKIFLARTPKDKIMNRRAYEFFAGLDSDGQPIWLEDISKRKKVFSDENGVAVRFGVIYNPGIKRYLLSVSHDNEGGLGIFEAPEPWGPWSTVVYYDEWLFGYSPSYHIAPQKWMSQNGENFYMVWSSNDRLNTIQGVFQLHSDKTN